MEFEVYIKVSYIIKALDEAIVIIFYCLLLIISNNITYNNYVNI